MDGGAAHVFCGCGGDGGGGGDGAAYGGDVFACVDDYAAFFSLLIVWP